MTLRELLLTILVASYYDSLTTWAALSLGYHEINPILSYLITLFGKEITLVWFVPEFLVLSSVALLIRYFRSKMNLKRGIEALLALGSFVPAVSNSIHVVVALA